MRSSLLFPIFIYIMHHTCVCISTNGQFSGGGARKVCGSYQRIQHLAVAVDDRIQDNSSPLKDNGGAAALHTSTTNFGSKTQKCGASLISDRLLITAAHCMQGQGTEKLIGISLGRYNLDKNPSPGPDTYEIQEVFIHPDYKSSNTRADYNDIAVLLTDRKVHYNSRVWPYCLPEPNQLYKDYDLVKIAGWGRMDQSLNTSPVIQTAFVQLVENSRCDSVWRQSAPDYYNEVLTRFQYPNGFTKEIICAGRDGVDACGGDSGGPMTHLNSDGLHIVIGVIAKGLECAGFPIRPGFYTNIANYIAWINDFLSTSPPTPATNPKPAPPAIESVATKCDSKVCHLPDCSCGGKAVPGGIAPRDTPQIVLLTFDDAINDLYKGHFEDLFKVGRKNPNGCPIQATFYVSHEFTNERTDYGQVQTLYAEGHEMASHSISHRNGKQFSVNEWAKEIGGQREILSAYGGVKMEDVRGMRAPYLETGGNKMFKMLYDQNFTYDSSMPVFENNPPSWPYTLDYKVFHNCVIPPCPTLSYPGIWQIPMVQLQDLNGGRCSYRHKCTTPPDAEGVYKMLNMNFGKHYNTNRAPFGLFYHASWFSTPHHKEGFIKFLNTITAMNDVWLTTNWQALQYVRDPVPLHQVKNYKPFQCNYPNRPVRCDISNVCNFSHKGSVRSMRTCQKCPEEYPWTGNTGVRSPLNDL